jgi:hypothetical protein
VGATSEIPLRKRNSENILGFCKNGNDKFFWINFM